MEIETRPYVNGIEQRATTTQNENDMVLGLKIKDIPFESQATAEKRARQTKAVSEKRTLQTKEAQKAKEVKAAEKAQREKVIKEYHENLRAIINKYK